MDEDPRVQARTVYWIDCTVCGPAGDAPEFANEADLWRMLLNPRGEDWIRRDDGRILCPTHNRASRCDDEGHEMMRWTRHPLDDELEWRYCQRCGGQFDQRVAGMERSGL